MRRTINELATSEINHILAEAPNRCYCEIAEEMEIPINTVKRVVRTRGLKRYEEATQFHFFKYGGNSNGREQ